MYSDNYLAQILDNHFHLVANCFMYYCRDLAVFLFPALLADFKDPIQNLDRVPALWSELHIFSIWQNIDEIPFLKISHC